MGNAFQSYKHLINVLWLHYRNCVYWIVTRPTCNTGAETSAGDWLGGSGASSWVVTGMYSISFSTALEHSFIASALLLPSNCILIMRPSPCGNPQMHSIGICQSTLYQWKQTVVLMLLLWNQHLIQLKIGFGMQRGDGWIWCTGYCWLNININANYLDHNNSTSTSHSSQHSILSFSF